MSAESQDREFAAFVGGRGTPLLRTAYLVTADAALAEDLVVDALARTRLDWSRAEGSESAETYVLRRIVAARTPAPAHGRPPSDGARLPEPPAAPTAENAPDGPPPQDFDEALDRQRIWSAFAALTQLQRAVVVLGVHESLDDPEIARLVGRSTRATQSEIARALAAMRSSADPAGHATTRPLNERLGNTLRAQALKVHADPGLTERALARADELRGRRRRTRLASVAGVVASLGVLALVLGLTRGDAPPPDAARPSASPGTPTAPPSRTGDPQLSVAAIPDAVLLLAQDEHALLGYGSTIIDGASDQLSVLIDVDPGTGASRGQRIEALARAAGGYVVLTSPPDGSPSGQVWTLTYVPRTGERVELGRVGMATPGFAVAPDGLSVVHVIPGPVTGGENALRPGETELVVQTLGAEVLNRIVVDGPSEPLALDPDKVWFSRPVDPIGPPLVWDRDTGTVQRLQVGQGWIGAQVQSDFVLMREDSNAQCLALFDAHDPQSPHSLWRACPRVLPAAIEPTGSAVAMLTADGEPGLLVVDAGTGAPLGRAAVDASRSVAMAWTSNGQRLLVETRDGGRFTVLGVPPPTTDHPVIGEVIVYDLGTDEVVLGRELPLPGITP